MSYNRFLEQAIEAASKAEEVILKYFQSSGIDVVLKGDLSPVTQADIETEEVIRETLSTAFPDHGFYGEETGQQNLDAEYLWLVDPIDGTKSFIKETPFFSTQIALMHKGELVVGVSNAPAYGQMMYATKGQGAFLNKKPVRSSEVAELSKVSLSTGNINTLASEPKSWQQLGELVTRINRLRGYGDFCHYHMLAAGQLDVVIESDVNILDIAALSVIVHEAGGVFTELNNNPLSLDATTVLATGNPQLHKTIRAELMWDVH